MDPAQGKARVFQMTAEEAVKALNVVTGTFLVNSVPAMILFDSVTNRSFVSPHFARMLQVRPIQLGSGFEVEIAVDSMVWVREMYDGCNIDIDGRCSQFSYTRWVWESSM